MKTIITYGTFDFFHYGHFSLLKRASLFGDRLIVGLSSDEFNAQKGKASVLNYPKRKEVLESLKFVDLVISENSWEQKESDILKYKVDVFVMGDDWKTKFDHLNSLCEVKYIERTPKISTTKIKGLL